MITKLSDEEIYRGFILDYRILKDEFKKYIYDLGFIWNRDRYKMNQFGSEGEWFHPVEKISIRARWGVNNKGAMIYVKCEFFEKIKKFFDSYEVVNGMFTPNFDYDTLNSGLVLEKNVDHK